MCLKTCAPYFHDDDKPSVSTMSPRITSESTLGRCGPGKCNIKLYFSNFR